MSIIYTPCECETPPMAGLALGTLWECDNCLALYRLKGEHVPHPAGQVMVARWKKVRDSPQEQEAILAASKRANALGTKGS